MKLLYVNSVRDTRPGVCDNVSTFRDLCAANARVIGELRAEPSHHTQKREMLKKSLKAVLFNGVWPDDSTPLGRKNEQLTASGLGLIDFDHVGDPLEFWQFYCNRIRDKYAIALAHVSASGDGLHIIVWLRAGQTISELYSDVDSLTGLTGVECDKACRNLGRIAFLPGPDDILLDAMESVFDSDGLASVVSVGGGVTDGGPVSGAPAVGELFSDGEESAVVASPSSASVERPALYRGLSRAAIVWALTRFFGGLPEVGERHDYVKKMAINLRFMCDNDVEWVIDSLPRIGLPDSEVRSLVETICSYREHLNMPNALRQAIEYVESDGASEQPSVSVADVEESDDTEEDDDDGAVARTKKSIYESDVPPSMPDVSPPLIDLLTSHVPDYLKPAVGAAVMPSLAAHLYNVVFRYVDGVEHLPALMSVIVGKQSVGKSAVNKPIQFIIEDIRRRDLISREREQAWKDECSKLAANKEKPQRPDDICIQLTQADMTNAAFVRRLEDAQGRFLYTNVDEIEMLKALRGYRADSLSQILRLAFDCGEYGQERVGGASVSATVKMRWCWMASTTPRRLQDFFSNNLIDGTLSRINLQYVHAERHQKIPKIKPYDLEFVESLQPYIDRLGVASGLYESHQVNELIQTLITENEEFSVLSDSDTYETFSYRSVVIAFRKAMILYIAHSCVWDDTWNDYIRWTMQNDMWCKLHFFGPAVEDASKSLSSGSRRGPRNLLTMLPEKFSVETLAALRHQRGMDSNPRNLLGVWTKRGYIRKEGNMYVQIKK